MPPLKPEEVTIIVDTREQLPFDVSPMQEERSALDTGDYSVKGLERVVRVERKELSDLVGCFTVSRDRFKAELDRLRAFPKRLVVVEASWEQMASGDYRSRVHPNSAMGSVASWSGFFEVGFMFCGNRSRAQGFTNNYLFQIAKKARENEEQLRSANPA